MDLGSSEMDDWEVLGSAVSASGDFEMSGSEEEAAPPLPTEAAAAVAPKKDAPKDILQAAEAAAAAAAAEAAAEEEEEADADADADADAEEQVLLADADATEADVSDGFGDELEAGAEESEADEDEDEDEEEVEDEVDVDGADEVMPKGLVGESDFEFEDEHGANKGPNVTAVLAVACLVFGSFTGFGAGIAAANAAAMANAPLAEPSPPPNCAQWKQPAKKAARLYAKSEGLLLESAVAISDTLFNQFGPDLINQLSEADQDLYYSGLLSIENLEQWGTMKPKQRRQLFAGLLETLTATVGGVNTYAAALEAEVGSLEKTLNGINEYATTLEEEMEDVSAYAAALEAEMENTNAYAASLESEVEYVTAYAADMLAELSQSSSQHSGEGALQRGLVADTTTTTTTTTTGSVLLLAAAETACQERESQAMLMVADTVDACKTKVKDMQLECKVSLMTLANQNHSLSKQLEVIDSEWSECEVELAQTTAALDEALVRYQVLAYENRVLSHDIQDMEEREREAQQEWDEALALAKAEWSVAIVNMTMDLAVANDALSHCGLELERASVTAEVLNDALASRAEQEADANDDDDAQAEHHQHQHPHPHPHHRYRPLPRQHERRRWCLWCSSRCRTFR